MLSDAHPGTSTCCCMTGRYLPPRLPTDLLAAKAKHEVAMSSKRTIASRMDFSLCYARSIPRIFLTTQYGQKVQSKVKKFRGRAACLNASPSADSIEPYWLFQGS